MKKIAPFTAIVFMALPLLADAQQTDSLAINDTTIIAPSAKKMAGAVTSITIKESYQYFTPDYNFSQVINGLATGLQSTNGSGQPGASADMVIRGIGSISGNNAPLILIDGIPYYGDYSAIDKNDIKSISVLSNAQTAFQFANRSSNGILSIVTKSKILGAQNIHKPKLVINAQFGTTTPELPAYKTLDTKQYFETLNSAIHNAGSNINVVDYEGGYNPYNVSKEQLIGSDGKLNPNAQLRYQDNWRDEMNRLGIRQNYHLETSAGGKIGAYYLAAGYLNDKGYVQQTNYERFSTRFNGHLNVTKWMEVGVRSQATMANQHYANDQTGLSVFAQGQLMAPIYPVYYRNSNGDKEIDATIGMNKFDWGNLTQYPNSSIGDRRYYPGQNGIGALQLNDNINKINTLLLNPYVSASFLKHFTYTADFNYSLNKLNTNENYNPFYGIYSNAGGGYYKASDKVKQLNFRQKLEWAKTWNKHQLKWLLSNDYIKQNNVASSESNSNKGGNAPSYFDNQNQYHILSYATIASYSFKDKYFASAGIRKDQTLAADYKWETNWFGALNYRISNENFLTEVRWIKNLELKMNYGTQGHSILTQTQLQYPLPPSVTSTVLPNNQISGGLEASLFNYKLSFEVLAYSRNSAGVTGFPAPPSSGLPPELKQLKFNNKGIELFLNSEIIKHYGLSWNTTFRLTRNINKIASMPVGIDTFIAGNNLYKKGNSVADFYLVDYAGAEKTTGQSLYYFTDDKGNKNTTTNYVMALSSGRKNFGSAFPKVYGSLSNTFEVKQFELSFQVNYSIGGKYYDYTYQALMGNGSDGHNWSADILNAWTPTNTNTNVPIVSVTEYLSNLPSSRFLKDASYLSLANAYLGYSFNYEKVKKLKMQSLRIYASANNLFMIAGRKGMNPTADFYNSPGYVYGPARTIVLGLKVGI